MPPCTVSTACVRQQQPITEEEEEEGEEEEEAAVFGNIRTKVCQMSRQAPCDKAMILSLLPRQKQTGQGGVGSLPGFTSCLESHLKPYLKVGLAGGQSPNLAGCQFGKMPGIMRTHSRNPILGLEEGQGQFDKS